MAKRYESFTDIRLGKMLFIMCWVAYFSTYLGRLNYSAAMPSIIGDQFMTKAEAGMIGTAFFACYGIGQFFCGFLGDKLSPFSMVLGGLSISAMANLSMFFCPSVLPMAVMWGINGLSQSMIWSPILRILSQVLPDRMRASACIHINSTVAVGTLCSYLLSTLFMRFFGWRSIFIVASACMIGACVFWGYGKKALNPHLKLVDIVEPVKQAESNQLKKSSGKLLPMLLVSGVVLLLIPTALHGALKDGIATWIPTYLTEEFMLTPEFAVLLSILLPVFNVTGAYFADFLKRKIFHDDILTAGACFFICGVSLLTLRLVGGISPILSVVLLAIATATMLGVNVMIITMVPMQLGKVGKASTVTGILNSSAYVGCAISMILFGALSELIGWSKTIDVWIGIAVVAIIMCLICYKPWGNFKKRLDEVEIAKAES